MIFLLEFILILFTVFLTQWVSTYFKVSPVFSSGFITLIFLGLCQLLLPNTLIVEHSLEALIFGASFIGMSSKKVFREPHILVSSLIYLLVFHIFTPLLPKIGGALGLSAFVAVVVSIGVIGLLGLVKSNKESV